MHHCKTRKLKVLCDTFETIHDAQQPMYQNRKFLSKRINFFFFGGGEVVEEGG